MGVRGGQDQRPERGQVQPVRQFAADDAAMFTGAAAGDDFDAAQLLGVGGVQETLERVEGRLGCSAVQIQRAGSREFSCAEAVPTRLVEASGVLAGDERHAALSWFGGQRRRWPRLGGGWHRDSGRLGNRDIAPGQGGDVTDVVRPFGTIVVCQGTGAPGHGFDLAGHAGLCMLPERDRA